MATSAPVEKLKRVHRERIIKWIGESVKFKLLYKATRDGMSAKTFHNLCDNKGQTIIVCWNTDDCVFGGYTSANWVSSPTLSFIYDRKAFLFSLKSMGKTKPACYPVKNPEHALRTSAACAPRFGETDFIVFGDVDIANDKRIFPNDLEQELGTTYQTGSLTLEEFSNNNFNYTEMEVYQLLESEMMYKAWRSDIQAGSSLKASICDYTPVEDVGVQQAKVLLLGSVEAGKSSFVSTVNSAFRGHVTSQAHAGSSGKSLTTVFRSYQIRNGPSFLKVRLCDTRGIEEMESIHPADILAMLDGHVPDLYPFNPSAPITPLTPGYIKTPTFNDKIHCVAYVIDATSVDLIGEPLISKFTEVKNIINQRGIAVPQVVLLTKVDKVSIEVEDNLTNLLYCPRIAEAVEKVSQLVGLPRGCVLPVKNYEKETELNDAVDRFALIALQQMLRFADDYMYNILDTNSM